MIFHRIYSGRVVKLEQIGCTVFGMRSYIVTFAGEKSLYMQCHQKCTLPVSVGAVIRFTAKEINSPEIRYYVIDEVLNSTYMDQLESAEQQRKVQILMEESYEQRDI